MATINWDISIVYPQYLPSVCDGICYLLGHRRLYHRHLPHCVELSSSRYFILILLHFFPAKNPIRECRRWCSYCTILCQICPFILHDRLNIPRYCRHHNSIFITFLYLFTVKSSKHLKVFALEYSIWYSPFILFSTENDFPENA